VEGTLRVTVFSLAIGAVLTWIGWRHWRYRKEETISLLEAGILKATGIEPLPRTRTDRALTYVHAILGLLLGSFFLLIGVVGILAELDVL
jgi:hypothetical protein